MPLTIYLDDEGVYCPGLACDFCGERIIGSGNYEYRTGPKGEPMMPIYFTHKPCSRGLRELVNHPGIWHWDELYRFPERLTYNIGMKHLAQVMHRYREAEQEVKGSTGYGDPPPARSRRNVAKHIRAAVMRRDRCCVQCESVEDLAIDHIIPLARGGTNALENLQVLCGTCNSKKGAN